MTGTAPDPGTSPRAVDAAPAAPVAVPSAAWPSLLMGLVGAMGAGYIVLAVLYLRDRAQKRSVRLAETLPVVQSYTDKPSVTVV